MKAGWQTKSFEECISKVTYSAKVQRKDFLNAGTYPIVSQEADLINGYWNNKSDLYKVKTPVVLFGDHTKIFKYVDFDFVLGADGVKLLLPREFLFPRFFFYQLQTADIDSLGYARHYRLLKELKISYSSLGEQQRIVTILDEAFEAIATARANAEQNLQNARALFENHLQSIFMQRGEGWVETTVGEQLTLQRGFDITKDQQRAGNIPVVSSGGIKSYHDAFMAKGPGVVIGRKGTLGKVHYLDSDYWPHDTTLWVKDFKGNVPKFVCYLLLGLDLKRLDTGTANPALNRNLVHPIKIWWPSISMQSDLVNLLDNLFDQTQHLEAIYQQKLAGLDELKKSLLHRAFSGQL